MRNLQRGSGGRKRPGLAWLGDNRDKPWELQLILGIAIFLVGSVVAITGAYYFDVATESRYFCGVLCHPNRPQYVAQEVSPHADVECGVCHVGPGLFPKVQAKIAGAKELYLLVTNRFDRPIEHPVSQLKPAEVICEQCHTADQFYEDQIERIARFAEDETNTRTQIALAVRIGGGMADENPEAAQASAAHWHIAHPVSYIARDADRQDIPWAAVMGDDGVPVEYQAIENPLSAEERAGLEPREMDCIDCHNRATHDFRNPEEWVNADMAAGRIDSDLPYVKREAMALLETPYETQEAGVAAMEGLVQFYQSAYPSVYTEREQAIREAVASLQEIYEHTTFPRMNLTWDYYPDNLGHTDFAGCFRCHDGKHVNAQEEMIPSNCTLCHSVPLVAVGDSAVESSILRNAVLAVQKPDSHRETDFVWEHRLLADDSCAVCHGTAVGDNRIKFGTDNSSFCANGICHGQEWPEPARLSADGQYADFSHPVQLVGGHADALCSGCHAVTAEPVLEDCAACHEAPSGSSSDGDRPAHYPGQCSSCHGSAIAWSELVFDHAGLVDCQSCHAPDAPANHYEKQCSNCHASTSSWTAVQVKHTGFTDCQSCHAADAPSAHYGDQCSNCHLSTATWVELQFDHSGFTDCQNCHADSAPANHYDGQCSNCHTATSWPTVQFNHDGFTDCQSCHAGSAPANHYGGQCSNCHATSNWGSVQFNHSGFTDCQSCHAGRAPANHYGGQCSNCHATSNWGSVQFNHSGFTDCQSCHAGRAPANHYGGQCSNCHTSTSSWGSVQFNHSGFGDCRSCHAGNAPPNHFQDQCSNCHSTATWAGASFAHTFPLDHRGANGNCQTCHPGGNYATYTCYTCHDAGEIAGKHREEGITDLANCVRCHPTGREEEGEHD